MTYELKPLNGEVELRWNQDGSDYVLKGKFQTLELTEDVDYDNVRLDDMFDSARLMTVAKRYGLNLEFFNDPDQGYAYQITMTNPVDEGVPLREYFA